MNNCKCKNLNIQSEQKHLRLPSIYLKDTHICSYDADKGYVIRMKLTSKEEFFTFMNKWSVKTLTKWRVRKSDPREMCAGLKNVFWQVYHCQNTSYRLQSRSTGCQAAFKVTIRKVTKRNRSKDIHIPEYPTIIIGHFRHNHAAMFNSKKFDSNGISIDVVNQFISLYKSGVTPAVALKQFKQGLKEQCDTVKIPHCPDRHWCLRLFAHVKRNRKNTNTAEQLNKIKGDRKQHKQFHLKHTSNTLRNLSAVNNDSNIRVNIGLSDINETLKQFTFFTDYIKQKMNQSSEYCEAVTDFNNACKGVKSDFELLKALRTFGSPVNIAPTSKTMAVMFDRRKVNNPENNRPNVVTKRNKVTQENDHTYSQCTFWNKCKDL